MFRFENWGYGAASFLSLVAVFDWKDFDLIFCAICTRF